MLIPEAFRREIGREAIHFCRRCPALAERTEGEYTVHACHNSQCRLWNFLRLLALHPGINFDAPTAEESVRQEHAREVRRFRGVLPVLRSGHDWEADARFHGLVPGAAWGETNPEAVQEEAP